MKQVKGGDVADVIGLFAFDNHIAIEAVDYDVGHLACALHLLVAEGVDAYDGKFALRHKLAKQFVMLYLLLEQSAVVAIGVVE